MSETKELANVAPASKDLTGFTNWPIVLLVLLGMIGFIFSLAWFIKRFGGMNFAGNREMRVVTSIAFGAKERVALIDIKGQQFLIGVTAQQITHLHSFDDPVIPLEQAKHLNQSDFITKFQSLLNNPVSPKATSDNKNDNKEKSESPNAV